MKAIVFLSLAGALVFGLVFIAQTQHDDESSPTVVVRDTASKKISPKVATIEPVDVSKDMMAEEEKALFTVREEARFEGDPWQIAVAAYGARDYELAVEALNEAMGTRETEPYAHYLLGLSYLKSDEAEGAVEEFSRCLELAPANVRALVNMSRAEIALGTLDGARASIDAALELDVEDVEAWNVLGRIELALGNLDEADAAFSRATQHDPAHAYALNNVGYVRILQGRYEAALEPLSAATRSGVEEGYFYNNLGVVLEQLGRLAEASDAFALAAGMGSEVAMASADRIDLILEARGESESLDVAAAAQSVESLQVLEAGEH